ncbi:MAG: 3-hydroxyacyl-CoA dehydrogenase/enoyl-CoA hydratase family protein [Leadbetterella sp.]
MNKHIKKIAVLGAGIMGSRIALHFANIGCHVLLLDIAPKELLEKEAEAGLDLSHPRVKNRIVNEAFQSTLKASPSPIYSSESVKKITLGNFSDDMPKIADVDWIIEVVVEKLEIKKIIYDQVEVYRKAGTLVTSNTSGIPIGLMAEGRSDDFQENFCGTHFFNPPRYLPLLEIIPGPKTKSDVIQFLTHYGDLYLGKKVVVCKDTPAFIANRIGIYALIQTIRTAEKLGLSVEDVDKLTGPIIGRPKSGTFRLSDVVGLDTTVSVCQQLSMVLKNDESISAFELPMVVQKLFEKKWLGDKTKQGFYRKEKDPEGKSIILGIDFITLEYRPAVKTKFLTLESTKSIDKPQDRFKILLSGTDAAGEFYRQIFTDLFVYATKRIPEISNELYRIDDAICAGFGWQLGIFQTVDCIGLPEFLNLAKNLNKAPADWVQEMMDLGHTTFYKIENGISMYYDIPSKLYKPIPGRESFIILDSIRKTNEIWKNTGSTLFDLGDGIVGLEFRSKMNTLGAEVIEGLNKAYTIAEKDFRGLVIGNESHEAFSAGANLAMLFMFAVEQEYDEINLMIAQFQETMMRARYSSIPVVTAPHTLALGGGCELNLHADKVVAAAETYMGLVELGVGLIPAGGGTKEMALRCSDAYHPGDSELNILQMAFMNIAQAKVSTSAQEAMDMNYIMKNRDQIVLNRTRLLSEAKSSAIELAENGYTMPIRRKDIKVQGKNGMALFNTGINSMKLAGYITEHDAKIASKLSYVINGGDLSYPQLVSETYLLELEREAFLSLCGERKTMERMQGLLNGGKPPRN